MKFIPYGHQSIDNNDINAVKKTLKNELITTGKEVGKFEKFFSKKVGSKYALPALVEQTKKNISHSYQST